MKKLEISSSWGPLSILGGSRAGEGTVIMLPQFRLAIDVGRPHRKLPSMSTVFISHGHADHLNALLYWASQRGLNEIKGGRILAPAEIAHDIHSLLAIHARMEGQTDYGVEILPVGESSAQRLRAGLSMEFFRSHHRVVTLGCKLLWRRKTLRDEFRGLERDELVRLRENGTELTFEQSLPILSYTSDTGPEIFAHPENLSAEILMLECSFWSTEDRHRARRWGHLHLEDILDHLPDLEIRHLVLLHPSRRYRFSELTRWIDRDIRPRCTAEVHDLFVEWE